MLTIFQAPTKLDLKYGMYLYMVVRQYRGDQSSK